MKCFIVKALLYKERMRTFQRLTVVVSVSSHVIKYCEFSV